MKPLLNTLIAAGIVTISMIACKKNVEQPGQEQISQETLNQIQALGFSTSTIQKHEDGYLVEGDIVLTNDYLNNSADYNVLNVANEEQYRTTNLVNALPRTIEVSISSDFSAIYVAALDEALGRYNAEKLQLTFQRVSSGADINIIQGHGSYLASAGFPSNSGNPYGQVKANSRAIGNQPQSTIATILAHEIGHCIGFRHTDYMDRSYSCGGAATNEGASNVGAINIPGTPTGPDARSWMLSCIGSGQNRPFNSNDKTALGYLY